MTRKETHRIVEQATYWIPSLYSTPPEQKGFQHA